MWELLVLVVGSEGTKMEHASASSKISATSNGSGVHGRRRQHTRNSDLERIAHGRCHGSHGTRYLGMQLLAPTRESRVKLEVRAREHR